MLLVLKIHSQGKGSTSLVPLPPQLACSSVGHFSWFLAVARPPLDSCSVTPQGALLVSRADPGIKLHFPPNSTLQIRTVTLQVEMQRRDLRTSKF